MEKQYPPFIEVLKDLDPELFNVVSQNMDLANQQGELDIKSKLLITMALDALAGSGEGVKSLAQTARNMGVTEGEIKETLRIAYMVAANKTLIAGLSAFEK
ncbi:carboxymuconolactone decarboxylase family protein [Irregularibacter muris]|uniref:Carboxymuconolactone decarboxylase family protein n=1 Tax=Irregularibacter muris TaxID=1796619 RepID=A0AAE3HG91_9FIRM|nr:carboxymuconolactone decarboxylase family protein [Irregularibacter muris]MCR1900027.1 carboxymuconolactone decarboxylase family protein [Irregularibacter muris]